MDKSRSDNLNEILSGISNNCPWDVCTFQGLYVLPSHIDDDGSRNSGFLFSGSAHSDVPGLGSSTPAVTACATELGTNTHLDHTLICNDSDFPASVVVHSRFANQIRWRGFSEHACAVTVGVDAVYAIISCYFPQSGLGFARFQSAIQTTRSLILSVPPQYRKHLMIGCDANRSLAASGPDDRLVGPNTFVSSNGPRAELLLDLLLEFSVCAVHTSGTDHRVLNNPANRPVGVPLMSPSWIHEWYPDRSIAVLLITF